MPYETRLDADVISISDSSDDFETIDLTTDAYEYEGTIQERREAEVQRVIGSDGGGVGRPLDGCLAALRGHDGSVMEGRDRKGPNPSKKTNIISKNKSRKLKKLKLKKQSKTVITWTSSDDCDFEFEFNKGLSEENVGEECVDIKDRLSRPDFKMHHETKLDADVIFISDSSDDFETVDLTTKAYKGTIQEHRKAEDQRVIGGDGGSVGRPMSGCLAALRGHDGSVMEGIGCRDRKGPDSLPRQRTDSCLPAIHKQNPSKKTNIFSRNKSRKLKKLKLKKERKTVITWSPSDDSDFEFDERFSPQKHLSQPKCVVHHRKRTPKKPAMLSLSKPANGFPSSLYSKDLKPKLTNLHLKHGYTSDSESTSESESDLPTCPFLFSHQRVQTASPILVELYPSTPTKARKRDVDPSFPISPLKKSKLAHKGVKPLDDSKDRTVSQRTPVKIFSPSPDKSPWKNITKQLLTLSDFSSSEEEFDLCNMRVMQTPSKQNWQSGTSPRKSHNPSLPRPCRKEDVSVGVPVHVTFQDTKCAARKGQSLVRNDTDKNKAQAPRSDAGIISEFCQKQRNMIEAVVDEDFIDDAIAFIRDFATLHRGAPEEYMMYLLKQVLLADKMEDSTLLNAYEALMHIHHLHPTAATSLTIDWDLVTGIVKKLDLETRSEPTDSPRLGPVLALQFIVVTIADDFQVTKKNNIGRKSYSFSLLSADVCLGHVRSVIQWICRTVTNKLAQNHKKSEPKHPAQSEDRNVWQFLLQFTKESAKPQSEEPRDNSTPTLWSEGYLTVLHLLQKLLLLSFAVGKSDSALKIAEEFLYPYLYIPSLEQRKICLQMLTCDPVRSKLIELLLENLCELNTAEQQGVLSIRKIVQCHFMSRPMRVSEFVLAERDLGDVADARGCRFPGNGMRERQREECEELAMLLFFLLQSYIRNKTAQNLQTSSNDVQLSQSLDFLQKSQLAKRPLKSQPVAKAWLSMDDRECLLQMGDHVEALEKRLRDHCDCLTPRTRLYLAEIESMRELA